MATQVAPFQPMNTTNPFPGMNPFMEQTWPDVHLSLIGFVREALGVELPEDLVAKAEQQVDVIESTWTDRRRPRGSHAARAFAFARGG